MNKMSFAPRKRAAAAQRAILFIRYACGFFHMIFNDITIAFVDNI